MRTVYSLDELLILPSDERVNGLRSRPEIRLEIPHVHRTALSRAQDSLNALQQRGGAVPGSLFMLLVMVVGVIAVLQRHDSAFGIRAAAELALVMCVAFGMGLAARFGARLVTRWQFKRRCREHHRLLTGELLAPPIH